MPTTFDWQNPERLLAEVRQMLESRADRIRGVPKRAIQRGAFELLKLIQAKAPKKTGTLVRSLHVVIRELSKDLIEGRVGSPMAYARYLEEGTGIYGPAKRPIEIVAKSKRALFWGAYNAQGGPLIAKKVIIQGIKPRGFFAQAIAEFLPRYVVILQEELAKEAA